MLSVGGRFECQVDVREGRSELPLAKKDRSRCCQFCCSRGGGHVYFHKYTQNFSSNRQAGTVRHPTPKERQTSEPRQVSDYPITISKPNSVRKETKHRACIVRKLTLLLGRQGAP